MRKLGNKDFYVGIPPPALAFAEMTANTVNIDGMDFERTDIPNGVDDSGLLVAKTLLTQGQAAHAAQRLQALRKSDRPITHGQIALHAKSGDADVTAWGHAGNVIERSRYSSRLVGQVLPWDLTVGKDSNVITGFVGELFSSALLTVQPGFENHPAAVNWLTSVALAAAKTEVDARFMVRLMREDEYNAFLRYVYGDMPEDDIKAMSVLHREGITGPVSVVGSEADKRTRRGITDAFGHMWNWLENLSDITKLTDVRFLRLLVVMRGAFWGNDPVHARVAARYKFPPDYGSFGGVRLVAVPRARENIIGSG